MKLHLNNTVPINLEKNYWLYLEPYTYCKTTIQEAFLYNTLDGKFFKTANSDIVKIIEDIYNPQNGGVILLERKILQNANVVSFINHLRNLFMGDIIDTSLSLSKPTQILPLMNLQYDIKKLKSELNRSAGENVLNYLLEIIIHFDERIDFSKLNSFLRNVPVNVRLTCKFGTSENNIQYSSIIDFLDQSIFINKYLIINYLQISPDDLHEKHQKTCKFIIIVDSKINKEKLSNVLSKLLDLEYSFKVIFRITSETEYEKAELIANDMNLENYSFETIYTRNNLSFFERNVFLTENDILEKPLFISEIFANQVLNIFDFGKIAIMSNGDIYANINYNSLGNIETHSIHEILYKEMVEGQSWFHIRNKKPCTECLYQFLCPSPSNYEFVIGKPNLCHVKP